LLSLGLLPLSLGLLSLPLAPEPCAEAGGARGARGPGNAARTCARGADEGGAVHPTPGRPAAKRACRMLESSEPSAPRPADTAQIRRPGRLGERGAERAAGGPGAEPLMVRGHRRIATSGGMAEVQLYMQSTRMEPAVGVMNRLRCGRISDSDGHCGVCIGLDLDKGARPEGPVFRHRTQPLRGRAGDLVSASTGRSGRPH
jgi:hypothetical protein